MLTGGREASHRKPIVEGTLLARQPPASGSGSARSLCQNRWQRVQSV